MQSLFYYMHRPQVSPCFVLCHQLSGKIYLFWVFLPYSLLPCQKYLLGGLALAGLAILQRGEGSVYLFVLWMGELR